MIHFIQKFYHHKRSNIARIDYKYFFTFFAWKKLLRWHIFFAKTVSNWGLSTMVPISTKTKILKLIFRQKCNNYHHLGGGCSSNYNLRKKIGSKLLNNGSLESWNLSNLLKISRKTLIDQKHRKSTLPDQYYLKTRFMWSFRDIN